MDMGGLCAPYVFQQEVRMWGWIVFALAVVSLMCEWMS